MFYIPQIKKDDCGFACLKMVLANINKDKNYLFYMIIKVTRKIPRSSNCDSKSDFGAIIENFPFIVTHGRNANDGV